ncbi:hypothetical protein G5B47_02420 [Paenibacillus sp. 7124]|uniref:Uncharacterized protein n=1 Tax=Paenibacillus apii TaxID=1850370 RepID=A0A6M1PH16_9BACL|nr:hypothetical protein [Paenibacillus apii]NGM81263.1 hypothetical protein [Paenibacillus apii]
MNWFLFASVIIWAAALTSVIGAIVLGMIVSEESYRMSKRAVRWSVVGMAVLTLIFVLSAATIVGAGM